MAGTKKKVEVTLECSVCHRRTYRTKKSKKFTRIKPQKLELAKYCKFCRKHTLHKEIK